MTALYQYRGVRIPNPERLPRRGLLWSGLAHVVVVLLLMLDFGAPESRADAIGFGEQAGGGGGGGGPEIRYLVLAPAAAPSSVSEVTPPQEVPQTIPVVTPEVKVIKAATAPVQLVTDIRPAPIRRLGDGPGSGGGPGTGSGSGGGVGSGTGTGIGSGVGPGTGGDGGDVLPPTVRYTFLPPLPKPDAVLGKTFHVRFFVDSDGRVEDVVVEPTIANAAYRKRFIETMKRYRFKPATTNGVPTAGETVVSIAL